MRYHLNKNNWRKQILTKTLYEHHIYSEKLEIVHVTSYNWKYTNVMNSASSLLLEREEMKSCIYKLETANSGMSL